ncbi:MAG: tRNA (guanosine(46)-N7)-methyltransferase TrmB [Alphaproteobacteria bacterium]|nr:tRNA (guanosine(46)-N7)-methyltransferase TrmB [Alphaproteobacteria bacterium]
MITSDDGAAPTPDRRRRVLYGRRVGRPLRTDRRRLLADLLPRLTLDLGGARAGPLDPRAAFAAPVFDGGTPVAPRAVWLEVGFGSGEHLAAQAAAHPDVGLIGCEPFINGVAAALQHIEVARLENVRIYPDDARAVIDALAPGCLARVFVLFPDPWPKARHAKRRFIADANLDVLARVMAPGAELVVASDDMGYVRWALGRLLAHAAFAWTATRAADWRIRPADQPATRYEEKAHRRGIQPVFLVFERDDGV